jgi:CelD/BcsL family acetyltransferase involved in cellulose biosynthesis
VVDEICREADPWDWANIAAGEVAPWFEPEWLPSSSYTELVKHVLAATVIDLGIPRVEEVLVGRRNVKESIRRAKNRLTKAYGSDGWSVERIADPAAVVPAFQRLVRLHEERSRAVSHSESHVNVFASPTVLAYVADVVQQLAARDRVSIYELVTDGELIASQLILHTTTASYSSVSGISEKGWPFSAVTYLQWHAIRHAYELGHSEFNLSIGPNQAKLRWSNQVRYFPDFVVIGPRRRSRVASTGAQLWSSVAAYRAASRKRRPAARAQGPAEVAPPA